MPRSSCSHRPVPRPATRQVDQPRFLFVLWPTSHRFPSRNGSSLARAGHIGLGVREIPIGKGAFSRPGFGPGLPWPALACSSRTVVGSVLCCLYSVACYLSAPRAPEKTRGMAQPQSQPKYQ